MKFSFNEATHCYTQGGIEIPSVTRTLDHAGLVSYDMIRAEILQRKSLIGTYVHVGTQYYDEGKLDWSSLDDHTKGRVEAWANFRAETGFVPRRIEARFIAEVNGMKFGLTVDREGLFRTNEAIIDIKTSATFQHWWAVQGAGYALGVPDFERKIDSPLALFARRRRIAIQLFDNGTYKKFDFNDRRDADVFMSALMITNWKKNHGTPIRKIE